MDKRKKKINLDYVLELERKDAEDPNINEYDYIFKSNHITSIDEQKLKSEEINNITKIKKEK